MSVVDRPAPARPSPAGAAVEPPLAVDFAEIRRDQVARYGGKNASLGEMVGVLGERQAAVPPGFATDARMFREFVEGNLLGGVIDEALAARASGRISLQRCGERIRAAFLGAAWPRALAEALTERYRALGARVGRADVDVAVRSSATAEDLPDASFAGQQETFLNVRGERALLDACRRCFASLYTDRAISYREAKGFDHRRVALSVGVQLMVRSDGGVLVTANTDPDWVPIMKRAHAIVTDHGGRTSHAAIVSRELGLPAIVGTGDASPPGSA